MAQPVMVPVRATDAMIAAAAGLTNPADVWAAMLTARPVEASPMMVTRLPTVGVAHRNPGFWADAAVRDLAIELHRQVTLDQARRLIADRFGPDRVPSKSALGRAWKRLDRTAVKPGYPQIRKR